jgi:hypothetical protein
MVHPVTLEIAQLAGKVEGEQAARGISIAFEGYVAFSEAALPCAAYPSAWFNAELVFTRPESLRRKSLLHLVRI